MSLDLTRLRWLGHGTHQDQGQARHWDAYEAVDGIPLSKIDEQAILMVGGEVGIERSRQRSRIGDKGKYLAQGRIHQQHLGQSIGTVEALAVRVG